MNVQEIERWLREEDADRLAGLLTRANTIRQQEVGNAIHLRGLLELSNICRRSCAYCGIGAGHSSITRYRMSEQEILRAIDRLVTFGYGTVVLQAGEDPTHTTQYITDLIRRIKDHADIAITLSLGERPFDDYLRWKEAGADRYLLRFETSDPALFEIIHPHAKGQGNFRLGILRQLREAGFEVGSGVMVGIPGQSWESLATDIRLFADLQLDMIGLGPYIPHPATPLAQKAQSLMLPPDKQVPGTGDVTLKVLALARIMCPAANIPSTTALATIDGAKGRMDGLNCGANVVMPNLTPSKYQKLYEIYPAKAAWDDDDELHHQRIEDMLEALGRSAGTGHGDSPAFTRRHRTAPDGGIA